MRKSCLPGSAEAVKQNITLLHWYASFSSNLVAPENILNLFVNKSEIM